MGKPRPNKYSQRHQKKNPGNRIVHIPVARRPKPQGMAILEEVKMTARERRLANFLGAGRALGTTRQHNGVVRDYFRYTLFNT